MGVNVEDVSLLAAAGCGGVVWLLVFMHISVCANATSYVASIDGFFDPTKNAADFMLTIVGASSRVGAG